MNNISGIFASSIQGLNKLKYPSKEVSNTEVTRKDVNKLNLHERSSVAQFVVMQKTTSHLSKELSISKSNTSPVVESVTGFNIEKVADTILSYMNDALSEAKAVGLSKDELRGISQQMREGFNVGFDQALDELGEIGILNDDLSNDINQSRILVDEGLTNISKRINNDPIDSKYIEANFLSANETARTSDIQITTKEGDKVTISFSQLYAHYQRSQYIEASNFNVTNEGVANDKFTREPTSYERYFEHISSSYESLSYAFTIDGDLDDDELTAIYDLIEQISKLQELFFSEDFQKALESASKLTLDDELASAEVDMTLSTKSIAVQTYETIAGSSLRTSKRPTDEPSPYIEDFDGARQRAFESANQVLGKVGEAIPALIKEVVDMSYREPANKANELVQYLSGIKKAT
jgi:hypothetical protein